MKQPARGWYPIPKEDEPAIKAAWTLHLQPRNAIVIPEPSRSWRGQDFSRHKQRLELEIEFSLKLMAAFRRCTRPGELLSVIDWQHSWFYLDAHIAGVENSPYPLLPNGDAYHYIARDFRFGVIMDWRVSGPLTLFGKQLLDAFDEDPPVEFLRVCGRGHQTRT